MSTSASASKIPNIKILKKSRKSDLLEDRLLVTVEQEVILPHEAQSVQLDSERSLPAEPITELSSSSEVNGSSSNTASGSELGNSGSLLLAQNGSKEDLGQLLTPFKSSLWTDLAEILNADTSSSGSGSAGLWGNELGELGDSSKDILLAQNTSKEDVSTSSSGSGSAGVDVSTSTMAMVLGGLALLGAAAGGGGGGGSSGTSTSSSSSSSSSSTTPVSAATSSGSLADGYIANALVFRDVDNDAVWDHEVFVDNNNNGIYDTGDTFTDGNGDGLFTAEAYAITNSSGAFTGLSGTGKIVATYLTDNSGNVLTTDVSTGLTFSSTYAAPDGSSIVNPLTSLIAAQLSSSTATATEIAAAQTKVLASLGVTLPTGSSLLTYDPLAVSSDSVTAWATAVAVQKVAAQVANTIQVLASAATGTDTSMSNATAGMAALTALATTVSAGTTIDLSTSASISSIGSTMTNTLVSAGTWTTANGALVSGQVTAAATSLATINTAIKNISATSGSTSSVWANVASTQKVAQSTLTTAIKTSSQGGSAVDASAFSGTALTTLVSAAASDTTAPVAPIIVLTTDSGSSSLDKITNTGQLTISGLETNAKVQYSTNGGVSWLRTFTAVEGVNKVQARQIDAAGNFSVASSTLTFTLDRTAPSAPTIAYAIDDVLPLTTNVLSGGSTNDTFPVLHILISGTGAIVGDAISLFASGVSIGSLVLTSTNITNGYVDIVPTTALTDGTYQISAKLTDQAGNISTASNIFIGTVDTVAPNTPRITSVTDDVTGGVVGVLTTGSLTNDATPTIRVSLTSTNAVLGDSIQIYNGTTALGTATTLTSTNITNGYVDITTSSLSQGPYSLNAKVIDIAGNASSASSSFTTTVDTTVPTAPTVNTASADDIINSAERTTGVTITGTTESGSTVTVNGNAATVTGTTWSYTFSAAAIDALTILNSSTGSTELTVIATDAAGNTTTTKAWPKIDTAAPSAPTITSVTDDLAPTTGTLISGGFTNDATPTIRVSLTSTNAVAGDSVQLYNGTTVLGTATTLTSTNITNGYVDITTSTLSQGAYTLDAKVIDIAGNVSLASSSFTTTVDTSIVDISAPNAPTITVVTDDVLPITGTLSSGGSTNDTTPTIRVSLSGTNAIAGNTVQLYNGTTNLGVATTLISTNISNGYVDITPSALSQGTYVFRAKVINAAGNASSASSSFTATIDTAAPNAPILSTVTDDVAPITGTLTSGGSTNDTTPTIRVSLAGTGAVVGDSVQIFNGTSLLGTVSTLMSSNITNGFVDITPSTALTDGNYQISVKLTDQAGNVSTASNIFTGTIDTLAPTAPTIAFVSDDVTGGVVGALTSGSFTNDTTPTIRVSLTGTGAVLGDSVQIYNGTTALGTATTLTSTNITNGFVDIITSVLSQGVNTLNAKVIDIAGNASTASISFTTTIDIATPILSTTSYNVAENLTTITTLSASDAGALTYSLGGTGVDNSKFSITSSGVLTFLTAKDFETPGSLAGSNTFAVTINITDVAGNTINQAVTITVTNVNEVPVITSVATASFAENGTGTVYTVAATDVDAGTTLAYSLSGTDSGLFNINSTTGAVTFKSSPNFESPTDFGVNNVYDINVIASDGSLTTTKAVTITVTNVNEASVITSGATASFAENATGTVYTVVATDVDAGTTLAYSLSGTDSGLFNINSTSGAITFKSSPNFEAPTDFGANNVYDIVVNTSDGSLTTTKAVAITVTNINEAPVISSGLLTTSVFEVADAAATSSTAYSLLVGQTAEGTISQAGDHDGYKVYLTGGVTYSFAMTGSGSDNLKDPYLRLYNSSGILIQSDDDNLPSLNSIFTYTPGSNQSGYYYIDASAASSLVTTGRYSVTFSEGVKPSFSLNMGAGVIDNDTSWSTRGTPVNISYGFRQTQSAVLLGGSNVGTVDCKLTTEQMNAVRASLSFWSDVCGLTFTDSNPGGYTNSATMLIGNYRDSDGAGAFAYRPGASPNTSSESSQGDVWLNLNSVSSTNLGFGTYSAHTIMHELGHAIGLLHPGSYQAALGVSITYLAHAQFIQDTDQYSIMTYFSGTKGIFNSLYTTTPMMFDILAAQNIYGVNNTTRASDTIYGFNSTAGSAYLFSGSAATSAFCIWDGNGTDTIDVSGFAQSQLINLGSGTFSDVGGSTCNVSIAVGCAIENAKGGSGKDVIFGNALNNVLTGGAGNDLIFGGAGIDTAIFSGAKSQYVISQITDGWSVVGADGTDWLFNMEFAQFSDQTTTLLSNASYTITSYVKASIAENSTTTVYSAAATDVDSTGLTYVLGGLDAGLFNISTSGALTFRTGPNYEAPSDFGSDNTYNITVRAFDGTNYSDAQEVAVSIINVAEAGDAVISLGSGMGQLIAPVQVDGGKWFYFWDINSDGISSVADLVNHNFLDTYFKYDSSNNINSIYGNVDGQYGSTFLHRFATINDISLALPNAGGLLGAPFGVNGIGSYQRGTGISLNSTNTTYDDLLAIWDAYNGNAGTSSSSSKFDGTPAGWQPYSYWSATPSTQGHATTELSSGGVFNSLDTQNWFVALQVL